MKYIVQILLLFFPVCCYSQQQVSDSLKRLLPTATTDSARFRLIANIEYAYSAANYDSALYYINKALFLAQKNRKRINEAQELARKGYILNRLQKLPESFQAFTAALQIAEDPRNENSFWNIKKPQVEDKDYHLNTLASILANQGTFLPDVGRADEAVFQFSRAAKLYTVIGDSLSAARVTANIGHLYFKYLNKPDSALLLEKTAESTLVHLKEERYLGLVYGVMGSSYLAKHNDSLGLDYMYQAIAVSKKYNYSGTLAAIYRVLAKFYIQEKNADSALYYAQAAAKLHIPFYPMDQADDFDYLAKSYELNHQCDSAYRYQGIALATYDSLYQNRIKGLTGFQQLSFYQQQQLQKLEADKIAALNRTRMYNLLAGLAVIMLIGFFLYRNNQQQKRANLLLQQQKGKPTNRNKKPKAL